MACIGTTDWLMQVKMGLVSGFSIVNKFGINESVTTSFVTITASGFYRTPTAATALEIVSDSANDTSAGSGAREVTIIGLNSAWAEVTQTVTMNGTTPVALGTNLTRLYRMYVSQSGTYASETANSHAGTITVRESGAGQTWAVIGLTAATRGKGQSQIGCYSIPLGKTGYLLSKQVHVDSTKLADVIFMVRDNANDVTSPYTGILRLTEQESGVTNDSAYYPKTALGPFVGPCDIGFQAKLSSGTSAVSVDFELLLQG